MRAARLRTEIATLARGGEYQLAGSLLLDLAKVDLRAGLRADALLRTRQAARLAAQTGDLEHELRAALVLAIAQIDAGEAELAEKTADSVLFRVGGLSDEIRPHVTTGAYLVRGMASRRAGHASPARVALDQCRERAARAGRADLSALALAELGAVDLAGSDPAAAAVCFWFSRDAFRLIGRDREARIVELLALTAFIDSGRADEALALATDALAEADARGDGDTAARAAGIIADARHALGDLDGARLDAADAAQRVAALGSDARGLAVDARLRQARLAPDEELRLAHLEAAVDLALSSRDAAAVARALDAAVAGLVDGTVPAAGWRVVAELARAAREAGLAPVADVADAALAELAPAKMDAR